MSEATRVLPPPDPDHCPQCAAPLVRLTGDGAVETYCVTCGFAVRQSAPRRTAVTDLARLEPPPVPPPYPTGPRVTIHYVGFDGWYRQRFFWLPDSWFARVPLLALLALAIRAQYHGYPSFEPVLFAGLFLMAFTAIVVFMPVFMRQIDRGLPSASVFALLPLSLVGSALAGSLAPVIGEQNYCGTHYVGAVATVTPPHVFRCTSGPFALAGFCATWWIAGWIVLWWAERRDGSD